jgi:hypothetical protein
MSEVKHSEAAFRLLMRHKERLRVAVYAIATHPETPERVRLIATSTLEAIGEEPPPSPGTGGWATEGDDR